MGVNLCYDLALVGFYPANNGSIIWRLNYLKEMLDRKGYKSVIVTSETGMKSTLRVIKKARKVILCRPSFGDYGNDVIRFCIDNNKRLVIDLDDAMFHDNILGDGSFLSCVNSYSFMKSGYKNIADSFLYADFLIVSTPKIQEMLCERYNKKSLRPNVISSSLCNKKYNSDGPGFKLIHASGTPTHLYDFSTIYLDLLTFMRRHSDVTLTILGKSIRKNEILWCEGRVNEIPYVPFGSMLDVYSKHDLLLVPLSHNDFNDAKSNIKYIEGGAVGVPVLAKDCAEFRSVITDCFNGFLYADNFLEKLEYIYNNRETLTNVGNNAFDDVLKNRSTLCELDDVLIQWLDTI